MAGICAASGCCCASWFPNYSGSSDDNETYSVDPFIVGPVLVRDEGVGVERREEEEEGKGGYYLETIKESGWNH